MKFVKTFLFVFVASLSLVSCNANGNVKNLTADEFEKGINAGNIQLVDVRTPEEYNDKHIANATNINVNGSDFESKMKTLDKSKATYIYCLAGSRSAKAAAWAASNGFTQVYNLEGGITSWIGHKKTVITSTGAAPSTGMTFNDYLAKIKSDKLVLVDFSAVWCGPCKMLKPTVEKLEKKYSGKMEVFNIDVDKNPDIATNMNIQAIPLLILYKNGKEVWRNLGLTDETTINEQIQKQLK